MVEASRQAGAGTTRAASRSWRRWPGWVGYAAGLMFVRLTLTGELASILGERVLTADNWAALAPSCCDRCRERRSAPRCWPTTGGAEGADTADGHERTGEVHGRRKE